MEKNRGLIVLFTLLIQCMIIVAINHFMLSIEDIAVFKMLLPWVNLIVVIVLILTIYSIRQVEKDAQNRVKVELLKKHVFETESLNALLNSQKHEFSRHVQAIQSMVYVRRYDELKEYVNAMAKEYRHSENLIKAGHSAIMTLINSKRSAAESQGIEFAVAIKCDLSQLNIPPWDLNSILGNLIENAMEAAIEDTRPRVAIEFTYQDGNYILYFINNGSTIPNKNRIFEPGFSTKQSLARGYGLFLVKKLIDHYGGDLELNCERNTCFILKLPAGDISKSGQGGEKRCLNACNILH